MEGSKPGDLGDPENPGTQAQFYGRPKKLRKAGLCPDLCEDLEKKIDKTDAFYDAYFKK